MICDVLQSAPQILSSIIAIRKISNCCTAVIRIRRNSRFRRYISFIPKSALSSDNLTQMSVFEAQSHSNDHDYDSSPVVRTFLHIYALLFESTLRIIAGLPNFPNGHVVSSHWSLDQCSCSNGTPWTGLIACYLNT